MSCLQHRPIRRLGAALVVIGLATTAAACSSSSKGGGGDTLTVAAGGITDSNAALYVALEKGYYADEHVKVSIKQAAGNASTLVVGGQADLGQLGTSAALTPIKDGKQTSVVFAVSGSPLAYIVGNPKIGSVTDCKKVTTTYVGSGPYSEVSLYEKAFGVT
jgi:ABC-type nitrate/sulfonate/bicarbonate transport system substrate-binding protein